MPDEAGRALLWGGPGPLARATSRAAASEASSEGQGCTVRSMLGLSFTRTGCVAAHLSTAVVCCWATPGLRAELAESGRAGRVLSCSGLPQGTPTLRVRRGLLPYGPT